MRIATWNLDVTSSPSPRLESWVAVVGETVEPVPFEVPYERMAVTARVTDGDARVIVYAAVLPWLAVTSHAPDVVQAGEDSMAAFTRMLGEQLRDVTDLQQRFGELVVWTGTLRPRLPHQREGHGP